ncbi:MAG: DUF3179 domain-containing (seleno)protein, partial [Pseudomonadota bacterium]
MNSATARGVGRGLIIAAMAVGLLSAADRAASATALPDYVIENFGEPPPVPDGPLSDATKLALSILLDGSKAQANWGGGQDLALAEIAGSGDPRLAWIISDLMRFIWQRRVSNALAAAGAELLGIEFDGGERWNEVTDHLIAWRIPAFPGYLESKREIFLNYVPDWDPLFVEGDIDWRLVSWGGVLMDARPYDRTDARCRDCIPAVDNPEVSSAEDATWLKDEDVVFGVTINGESRAYPRRIMEVREMVNDTLGGRDLGIPYCTLCGAAQAFFTDDVPDGVARPVLRTSGLLSRSNKVMFDVETFSVFDTFLGKAVTGPLAEKGVQLKQATVVTTDWGSWRRAHPDTTVLIEAHALGRDFDFRSGRDANGPIFPVGDVDPRLPVQEDVIGVITASGEPVAFPR